MPKMLISAAVAVLCAASLPAFAQDSDQSNSSAAQPSTQRAPSGSDERRICVNERVSESRMTRRVCRTARQWREMNDTDFDR